MEIVAPILALRSIGKRTSWCNCEVKTFAWVKRQSDPSGFHPDSAKWFRKESGEFGLQSCILVSVKWHCGKWKFASFHLQQAHVWKFTKSLLLTFAVVFNALVTMDLNQTQVLLSAAKCGDNLTPVAWRPAGWPGHLSDHFQISFHYHQMWHAQVIMGHLLPLTKGQKGCHKLVMQQQDEIRFQQQDVADEHWQMQRTGNFAQRGRTHVLK